MGNVIYWVIKIVAAVIMLQTLFFKFSGAEESILIFETIGIEPWGRYGVGIAELVASIMLLIPKTDWIGGVLTFGLMLGAIAMHLFYLGIEIQGDGGLLFIYALVALTCSLIIVVINRNKLLSVFKK